MARPEAATDRRPVRQAIEARHPGIRWDRRYPLNVLADNGIIDVDGTSVRFVERLDAEQVASLLSAQVGGRDLLDARSPSVVRAVSVRR